MQLQNHKAQVTHLRNQNYVLHLLIYAWPWIDMLTDSSCTCKEGKVLGCRWLHYPSTKHSTYLIPPQEWTPWHYTLLIRILEWFSISCTHEALHWLPSVRIPPKQNLNGPKRFFLKMMFKIDWTSEVGNRGILKCGTWVGDISVARLLWKSAMIALMLRRRTIKSRDVVDT